MEGDILRDKMQEIVDTFNLLSPENQDVLLECACNTLKAEKSASCALKREAGICKEGDTCLLG
jgi:hypothetical protein